MAARPLTQHATVFRERRRKGDYGLGHVGDARHAAKETVDERFPMYGRVYGEYVLDHSHKPEPHWPERVKVPNRPLTTGVPSFPLGGVRPDVGGVAGCPDAIRFLRSITGTPGTKRGVDTDALRALREMQHGSPREVSSPGGRRDTGNSYAAKRREAEAAVKGLRGEMKAKLGPQPAASPPPWNLGDDAAETQKKPATQPRADGYRYSRGGLPSSWGKMGAPPASSGGQQNKGRAAYTGPPVGTPLDQAAMKAYVERERAKAAASRGGTPGTRPATGVVSRGGLSTRGSGPPATGMVAGVNLNDDTTEALLDELTRRGLMPKRPDTSSMETALKSLAACWDEEGGGAGTDRGRLASSASRKGTARSRAGVPSRG